MKTVCIPEIMLQVHTKIESEPDIATARAWPTWLKEYLYWHGFRRGVKVVVSFDIPYATYYFTQG